MDKCIVCGYDKNLYERTVRGETFTVCSIECFRVKLAEILDVPEKLEEARKAQEEMAKKREEQEKLLEETNKIRFPR